MELLRIFFVFLFKYATCTKNYDASRLRTQGKHLSLSTNFICKAFFKLLNCVKIEIGVCKNPKMVFLK